MEHKSMISSFKLFDLRTNRSNSAEALLLPSFFAALSLMYNYLTACLENEAGSAPLLFNWCSRS